MGKHSTTYWDRATAADAATRAKQLLDTVYILKTSAIESRRLKNKVAGDSYSRKMEEAYIRDHRQVAAVSPLPRLLCAYALRTTQDGALKEQERRRSMSIFKNMWQLKCFVKLPLMRNVADRPSTPTITSLIVTHEHSKRLFVVTPSPTKKEHEIDKLLKGTPRHLSTMWSKMDIVNAL